MIEHLSPSVNWSIFNQEWCSLTNVPSTDCTGTWYGLSNALLSHLANDNSPIIQILFRIFIQVHKIELSNAQEAKGTLPTDVPWA